jgi:cysteinyl-tRNA synthetase
MDDLVHRANDYADGLRNAKPSQATLAALREALAALEELTGVLGIALDEGDAGVRLDIETTTAIEALVAQRDVARQNRDWPEADRIRRELDDKYRVVVKDTPHGTTWSVRE